MTTEAVTCVHWWRLETPSGGPTCTGTCKKCGATKDTFRTSVDDWTFVPDGKYGNNTTAGQFTSEGGRAASQKSRAWRENL